MKNITIIRRIAKSYNTLDYRILEKLLTDDFTYNSYRTTSLIIGKQNFIEYIKHLFESIKLNSSGLYAELAFYKGEPQLIIAYNTKYERSDLLILEIANNKIHRMTLCDFKEHFTDLKPTFRFPGLVESKDYKYMDYTIEPKTENCIQHCINAISEFKRYKITPPKNRFELIDWRMKYIALKHFRFPLELKYNADVKKFKRYFNESINFFNLLLNQDEKENCTS